MRHFMVPCVFGDVRQPFPLYVGEPVDDAHPLEQQQAWLERERGGVIPDDVLNSFTTLHDIAMEHQVSFEELVVYAMEEADKDDAAPPSEEGIPRT